ncbi:MAG: TetR/AcrR family transcriptional regulator [Mycetocola sp.]
MPTEDVAVGLREKNRERTARALHEAAISCVEQYGLRGATVAQISDAAGVAPRTFFRYYATKEDAVLPGHANTRRLIRETDLPIGNLAGALNTILDLAEAQLGGPDSVPEFAERPRIERLIHGEPELKTALVRQVFELTDELTYRLIECAPDEEPLRCRLAAELFTALWRTGWERWRLTIEDPSINTTPIDYFRQARAALGQVSALFDPAK